MNAYVAFVLVPIAVIVAIFSANQWPNNDPLRYRVPPVTPIEEPADMLQAASTPTDALEIRVGAFLPQAPPKPPPPVPNLILQSVMTATDGNLATINGQVVRVGDRIQEYTVRSISESGVELESGGYIRKIPMRPLHEISLNNVQARANP